MKKETKRAIRDAFAKLSFRSQAQNPVMLMVYLSACLTTVLLALALAGISDAPWGYIAAICVVLWATVLFGNFAESLAEGRGKAQADALRSAKRDVEACLIDNAALADAATMEDPSAFLADRGRAVGSATLKRGQVYLVRAGEQVPADGEVIMGAASVDESAITGESAPVVRESGGDRSSITGGTTVLSDWLVARVTAEAGQSFLDKMIAMVESAARKKTPNEQALELLLIALTLVFLAVSLSLYLFGAFTAAQHGAGNPLGITSLVALFVCLAPTTIGALLSAIGIAGMSRLNAANVLATSGRAVEAAGDVDVLLLDKTGTITLGNRQAAAFLPVGGVSERELADAAQLASLADETPEGRSVVVLAKERFGIRERELAQSGFAVVPFTAQTRMSGVDFEGHEIRKGAADAVRAYVEARGGVFGAEAAAVAEEVSRSGGTPLVVARDARVLGVIHLKDIIKSGIRDNFADLRAMGIKTVMVTGDNPLTAAAIAAEAGLGHARSEACGHPPLPGRGASGRHDRRRHQRRSGAGPSRCGRGHELRHSGGQGGRQHGGPGFLAHQAHRNRAHRQAAAHDPRQPHHVFDRQRPGKVLRGHPGAARAPLSGFGGAQHHASGHTRLGDACGHHIQRSYHRRAHSACVARGEVSRGVAAPSARAQFGSVRLGRRDRSLCGHQGARCAHGVCRRCVKASGPQHGAGLRLNRCEGNFREQEERIMSGKMVTRCFASALASFIAASVLCGIVYPWAVTGLSAIAFPYQATGSIIEVDGVKYGSELVGQPFKSDTHLWGRPTVVDASSFSDAEGQPLLWYSPENLSPASDEFAARVDERIQQVRAAHPDRAAQPVPSDLVTVSGSGFDPHISPAAADYQVERIAAATGRPEREVRAIIAQCTEYPLLGIIGEARVNVLKVNLMLDGVLE